MLMADTVMDADERFQIGEDEMDDRQIVLGNLWVAALGNGKVFIPALADYVRKRPRSKPTKWPAMPASDRNTTLKE